LAAHLRPTAKIAPDVVLPGDPGLALALAQELLERPLMANHSHGLWGYSGRTPRGQELTVQATGIGGPSAAVVLAELADHGARRAIRLGRAVALDRRLGPGDPVIASRALAADGTSRALGGEAPEPESDLNAALTGASRAESVTVVSFDLFHDPERAERRAAWLRAGAAVADLESATVLALGARLGLATAAALVIAEDAGGERDEGRMKAAELRLGAAAADALAAQVPVDASS
jgi:uridine phosphorylase